MSKDEERKEEKHPAFGVITLNRTRGGRGNRMLFGSRISDHPTTMCLEIKRAVVEHDRDWIRGEKLLIEVEMSPHQFGEFITSANSGAQVPCTILYTEKEGRMEEMPPTKSEQMKAIDGFQEQMNELLRCITPGRKRLYELTGRPGGLKKAEKIEIRRMTDKIFQFFETTASFVLESFSEAANSVMAEYKAEVDALMGKNEKEDR